MNDSGITCDEIMDMDSEAKSNDEAKRTTRKQKLSEEVLLKKRYNLQNTKFLYFTCLFISYHCSNDNCWYLVLSDTI